MQALIEAHVDATLKQRAEAIYASAGLTLDQAVRSMLEKTVEDGFVNMDFFRAIPETLAALQELRNGGGTVGSLDDLFRELDGEGPALVPNSALTAHPQPCAQKTTSAPPQSIAAASRTRR